MRSFLVLALIAAACKGPDAPLGEADCREIAERLAKTSGPGTEMVLAETARPSWVESCRQRYTRASLKCIRDADSVDELLACPENDLRPPAERPEATECASLVAHVRELVAATSIGQSSPKTVDNWADATAVSCRRYLRRADVTCQLAAKSVRAIAACTPPAE